MTSRQLFVALFVQPTLLKTKNTKTKMSDGSKASSTTGVHNLQVQENQEVDKGNEGAINNPSFLFKPTTHAIDDWLATSTTNSPISNKYSITSTGNGNVEISRK